MQKKIMQPTTLKNLKLLNKSRYLITKVFYLQKLNVNSIYKQKKNYLKSKTTNQKLILSKIA